MHYLLILINIILYSPFSSDVISMNCCADKKCKGLGFLPFNLFLSQRTFYRVGDSILKSQEFRSGFQSYAEKCIVSALRQVNHLNLHCWVLCRKLNEFTWVWETTVINSSQVWSKYSHSCLLVALKPFPSSPTKKRRTSGEIFSWKRKQMSTCY